jgi:heme A synthase
MGTIGDWGVILAIAVFVGLYAWLRDMGRKPHINRLYRSLAGWILFSSVAGIWSTFRWRAFGVPLVFITIPVSAAALILIYSARPRGGQPDAEEPFREKHNPRSHSLEHH